MRPFPVLSMLLALICVATTIAAPTPLNVQRTPAGALRAFVLAMLSGDKSALRHVSLPLSEADLADLTYSKPMPPAMKRKLAAQVQTMTIRVVKPGATYQLSETRQLTVKPNAFGPDRTVLDSPAVPLPASIRRINGLWYVDPSDFLAARRAGIVAKPQGQPSKGR